MAVNKDTNNLPSLYVLPSDNKELQSFSKKFKSEMMEQVVSVIEFAVNNNLPFVEVFQFKNSDFVITLSEKDYSTNLDKRDIAFSLSLVWRIIRDDSPW